ncbi:MAG: ribonuclease T2 family protein [Yoonia sp.]|uniref:ribonuclease T2 family protein n=1 Tax=Yoonia sp. TaxID=2212373 RepID=UPI003EF7E5E0
MFRLLTLLCFLTTPVAAQDRAGDFDYYVMSLSWSPNWCALEGDARNSPQCEQDADYGWILHGLWPQYEAGYPANCPTAMRSPSRSDTAAMADIMGTSGLAWHQWRKHGVCSGLSSDDYYDLSRAAFATVNRPEILRELTRAVTLPASLIEEAFLRDNPTLAADQITITCKAGYIQEARICLTKDLEFRDCGRDVRRDCTLSDAAFAPMR